LGYVSGGITVVDHNPTQLREDRVPDLPQNEIEQF
jgi:hypothetical protein